jgi:hypothetical protein
MNLKTHGDNGKHNIQAEQPFDDRSHFYLLSSEVTCSQFSGPSFVGNPSLVMHFSVKRVSII